MRKHRAGSIYSLQGCLRRLSQSDPRLSPVVPDGVYGARTEAAVKSFQLLHSLPPTGRTDEETWDAVWEAFSALEEREGPGRNVSVFPGGGTVIPPGKSHPRLPVLQAMLCSLAEVFPALGSVSVTGTNDSGTADAVRQLQTAFGLEPTGAVDNPFWLRFSLLYESWAPEK